MEPPIPKFFLYFRERNPLKKLYVFSKENCSYISGNGKPKKALYISENGIFLYSRKGIFRALP